MKTSSFSAVGISVVIPTYNRASELDRCLDSLVKQTYKNFEVLVCDDGSTDLSKEVVDRYKDKLDLTYIFCENFGGPARPRNLGINAAKSPYIAFLDSDDWWVPEKLSVCIEKLSNSDVDLLYHDMWISSSLNEQNQYLRAFEPKRGMFNALLTTGVSIPNSSVIVRRHLLLEIGGVSEDRTLISVEDYDTWVRVAQLTDRFFRIPLPLGYYGVGSTNISTASTIQVKKINYLYAQYELILSDRDLKKSKDFLIYRNAYIFLGSGEFDLAKKYFRKAFLSNNISFHYRMKSIYRYLSLIIKPR